MTEAEAIGRSGARGRGGQVPAIFDGVPTDELTSIIARNVRRRFALGDVVIGEGDAPDQLFVIVAGNAEVTVAGRDGASHTVNRLGPGMTFGEMSLITGEPAAGTVFATDELEVIGIGGPEFERIADRFPVVHRNVGLILAQRLAKTTRLVARPAMGRLIALDDDGAPPLLAWALACSIAWHTRSPTVLVVTGDRPPEPLAALAAAHGPRRDAGASLRLSATLDGPGAELDELQLAFDHVLVMAPAGVQTRLLPERRLVLADSEAGRLGDSVVIAWARAAPARLGPSGSGVTPVPALTAADGEALAGGSLPARTPAGRALGWLARDLTGLKVGLAYGAGSIRGYAHVGVLTELGRVGLVPDYLAGTSVGAAVAVMQAMGYPPAKVADVLDATGEVLFRPTISHRGLLSNRALRRHLRGIGGDRRLEEMPVPLAVVAADIERQQEVVLRRGPLWSAVLASITIPGVLPAVRIGGHALVDGGVVNPVPAGTVSDMGAGAVVAVRLSSPSGTPNPDIVSTYERAAPGSSLGVIMRSMEMMQGRIGAEAPETPLVTVAPLFVGLAGAKLRKFSSGRRFIEAGAAATEAALPRLATVFPWLRT
jgi:NTE family protein